MPGIENLMNKGLSSTNTNDSFHGLLDNTRVFAAGRSGTLRILVREDAGPSPLRLALEAGAPADLFISADTSWVMRLVNEKNSPVSQWQPFLRNRF